MVDLTRAATDSDTLAPTPPGVFGVVVAWVMTVVTLVVLDDLLFGPAFWLLSRSRGPAIAFATAFVVYLVVQVVVVRHGTRDQPGRVAAFFLSRLHLERPDSPLRPRHSAVKSRVIGGGSAVLLSPILGGVVPPMLLWHRGFERTFVLRISMVTATIYALEFGLLHGWVPGLVGG